jgi:hypothetical protein
MNAQGVKAAVGCLLLAVFMTPLSAQSPAAEKTTDANAATDRFGLEDGTVVELRLVRDLLSSEVKDEDSIEFEVIEDVTVEGVIVIARGAAAEGTIIDARKARRMGRSGRIGVRLDWVHMTNGKRAPLRAVAARANGSRAGAVTDSVVVATTLFFPAAPLFLLIKGKEVTIPKGTLVTSFIDGNKRLNRAEFK